MVAILPWITMAHEAKEDVSSANFATTQWSVVLATRQNHPARAQAALERLCSRYWYPLYAFIRRRGHDTHEAEDLTQSFFAHLLDKEALRHVDQSKGLFRTFLLTSLVNFLHDEHDRQSAIKRGGRNQIIPLDKVAAEELYHQGQVNRFSPEQLFEQRWAFALVEQGLARLRSEQHAENKREIFDRLEPCLTGEVSPGFYEQCAAELSMSSGAVRVALHRMRRRLGALLRSEIAHTVSRPEEVEEEIQHLFSVLGQ